MALSIDDGRSALAALKKDISDVSTDNIIKWSQFIADFIYRELIAQDAGRFIKTTNISVTAGVSKYSLPADFRDISAFGTGLWRQDSTGNVTDDRMTRTGFGSQQVGYYIEGGYLYFTPTPTQNINITLRYIPKLPRFTATTDYFTNDLTSTGIELIPDEFLYCLRGALDVQYCQWDEEPGAEGFADARFVRALDEYIRYIRAEGAVYGLFDYTQMF